uniref:AlNc14C409G11442 protein n=1 Tax=Albugo laibachii Nc14 TaxID=890382 RepID=F0WZ34_9STRA|nr:AlNc14C409G11442 [Albugo laibachii Nc14]|eukprot:CCA26749.1 AlNc14C409G11442 [Albugo laibachii Nc14]
MNKAMLSLPLGKILIVAVEEPKPMMEALLVRCKVQLAEYQVQARNVHVLLLRDANQFLPAIYQGFREDTFDGIICIGCVLPIKHGHLRPSSKVSLDPSLALRYDAIIHEVMEASLDMNIPVIWGVLPATNETDAVELFGLGKEEGYFAEEVAARVIKMAILNNVLLCHPRQVE